MGDFKQLVVWQRSTDVAVDVYSATRSFPRDELYGLTSQTRRAAISVTANIAEGSSRFSARDQARCYRLALSSANELESLIILSERLAILAASDSDRICGEVRSVQRMLSTLIRRILS